MLNVIIGAAQVGIFAREGNEVHIVGWAMLGIVGGEGDDGGSTRGIVVGTGVENLLSEIAQVVVMGGKDVTSARNRSSACRHDRREAATLILGAA